MLLAKAFPKLRFCIQDRPKTIEMGLSVRVLVIYTVWTSLFTHLIQAWKDRCPDLLSSGRVTFEGNMATPWRHVSLA
jgi:hypothetical protein